MLGTAASTSARQCCHPTRRASRVDLPLQGRWGNIVAVADAWPYGLNNRGSSVNGVVASILMTETFAAR